MKLFQTTAVTYANQSCWFFGNSRNLSSNLSVQKAAIREKLVNHLSESNCVIDPHVIERIVNEAHLFIQPDSLVTDFGMNVELLEQIAHILASSLSI